MNSNRITLVTLGVTDLDRSRAYYEALGWAAEESLPTVVFYDMGGSKFGLFPLPALAKEQGRSVNDLANGAMTLAQNFGSESEVDAMWQRAIDAGASSVTKPTKTEWGGYSGYVADPDGHIWEFAMNPFWSLDGEGHIAG